jgi:IS1 family transposase
MVLAHSCLDVLLGRWFAFFVALDENSRSRHAAHRQIRNLRAVFQQRKKKFGGVLIWILGLLTCFVVIPFAFHLPNPSFASVGAIDPSITESGLVNLGFSATERVNVSDITTEPKKVSPGYLDSLFLLMGQFSVRFEENRHRAKFSLWNDVFGRYGGTKAIFGSAWIRRIFTYHQTESRLYDSSRRPPEVSQPGDTLRIENLTGQTFKENWGFNSVESLLQRNHEPGTLRIETSLNACTGCFGGLGRGYTLPSDNAYTDYRNDKLPAFYSLEYCVPLWRAAIGTIGMVGGILFGMIRAIRSQKFSKFLDGYAVFIVSGGFWLTGYEPCEEHQGGKPTQCEDAPNFHVNTVTQKLLTTPDYCNTLIVIGRQQMANVLSTEKQSTIVGLLAEGSSIRSIERITGVHRDTIMRLGVRVGQGCAKLLDAKMQNLSCKQIQFDEIWGFIGKKERHCTPDDSLELGDVWTFCAIDADTKLVPSFKVGKRDLATANAFVSDVASRLRNRVQISSDALRAYVDAVEMNFGADVDFAQIIKTYITDDSHIPERRFSAPEIVVTEKKTVSGFPDLRKASTSHIERLNGTTRLHMRRLTRLTYAFSKKLENFEAAVALHFAYYNFVKRHITLRATPAMAAGIERDFLTVGNLVEASV